LVKHPLLHIANQQDVSVVLVTIIRMSQRILVKYTTNC